MRSPTFCLAALLLIAPLTAAPGNRVVVNLEPTPGNPRNSEGSFVTLKSGRILFCYSQFYGGHQDESPARIAEIHSDDRGLTWSQPRLLFDNGSNQNVMSVSLLRLASGKLAVFYAVKRDAWRDCHPVMRVSSDEGASWSDPRPVISAPGYFVLNNDRVIQSSKGRLIVPVAFHRPRGTADERDSFDPRAIALWYTSDDEGVSWKESSSWWAMPVASRSGLQEPGVVELADGSLFSWARTDQGCQFGFRSRDGGDTWSPPEPTEMKSPVSPSSIRKLPGSDALLAVYNDHSGRYLFPRGRRTPLVAAVSEDGGATWPRVQLLEDDPSGWYCYTAIHFVGDAVLLGYCAGDYPGHGLDRLRIRRFDLAWLSEPQPPALNALATKARSILHRIVASDQTFVKIHAAESLTPFGEAEPVRRLFLAERPQNEESAYRVGVWRVLSATAHSESERAQWVRKVEEVFLAPAYPNRIQALETLCKVRDRLSGKTLEAARELAAGKNASDEVMALWACRSAANQAPSRALPRRWDPPTRR